MNGNGLTALIRPLRHATALAGLSLKLIARDRRAFVFSLLFPLTFLFVFGTIVGKEGPAAAREVLPMLVGLSIITGSFFGQGMGLVVQRERGMLRRYRLTPIGSGALILGTLIAGLVMLAFTVSMQLFLLHTLYHAPLSFRVLPFLLAAVVGAVSMASLGLVIAAVTSTMQEAQITFQITFMGTLFLSGVTIPMELFPRALQWVAVFLPPTHMMRAVRDALQNHLTLRGDGPSLLALCVMAAAAFTIATRLFRWDKDDPLPRRAKLLALLALIPVLAVGLWQQGR